MAISPDDIGQLFTGYAGAFAILVIAELWRSYQELDSARTLENVRVPSAVRHGAAPIAGRVLMGE